MNLGVLKNSTAYIACYSFLNPAKMCYNSTNLLEHMKVLENFHGFLVKEVRKVCIQMIV